MTEIMRRINRNLLPVKLHYFLYYGAEAGILPFLSVIAGQIGISATALGVIFTVLPFVSLAAKPLFGGIADHLQKLKLILFIFVALACISYLSIGFIPTTHHSSNVAISKEVLISCDSNGSYVHQHQIVKANCVPSAANNSVTSYIFNCESCSSREWMENRSVSTPSIPPIDISICANNFSRHSIELVESTNDLFEITNAQQVLATCTTPRVLNCSMSCKESQRNENIYGTMQFWLFFLFAMLAWASSGVVTSLSDAACFEVLEGKDELYGKQRMWGTIGWGLFCLFTGYLNDLVTTSSSVKDYSPSLYVLGALMVCDLCTVAKSTIKNAKTSSRPVTNVCGLLSQTRILSFIFTVFVTGSLTGLHWAYFFWYMNELKADQLTMSLAVGIQSFLGELPFFFFAGKIISKIGHVYAANVALLLYSLRYALYSLIYDPWLVLPVELIQGPTFGLFYATMTSYAKFIAPPQSEATMQGILGGVFEGFGIAVGGLLGGIGIDYYGTHKTFIAASVVALTCCVLYAILDRSLPRTKEAIGKASDYKENETEERQESAWVS